jgi:hypothetical protein
MKAPTLLSADPLTIYLNDHLAGATAGVDLAHRSASQNLGTEFGSPLQQLADEIEHDRAELVAIIETLGCPIDRAKVGIGWTVEKLARLKPNGRILGYSPLSRLLELEGLGSGIRGKRALWRALGAMSSLPEGLDGARLEQLVIRADVQLELIDQLHERAAEIALEQEQPAAV